MDYAKKIIKDKTTLLISREEIDDVIKYYKESKLDECINLKDITKDIPRLITTNKKKCECCHSKLTFHNDRMPSIGTSYDLIKGSEMVGIFF